MTGRVTIGTPFAAPVSGSTRKDEQGSPIRRTHPANGALMSPNAILDCRCPMSVQQYRTCFHPSQWWTNNAESEDCLQLEGCLMWVYRVGEDGKWEVGYYLPDKSWFTDSSYPPGDEGNAKAAARVNYLMGGK